MVSHDELMRFVANGGTKAPTIPPCNDVAAGNSTVVGLSLNTGLGDREITHCEGGAVSNNRQRQGKYSDCEYENSSCDKLGDSSSTDFHIEERESTVARSDMEAGADGKILLTKRREVLVVQTMKLMQVLSVKLEEFLLNK